MLTSRELPRVASHLVRVKSYVEGKRRKREAREGEEGEKKRARLLQLYYFIPRRLPSFPSSRSGILEILEIVWRRIRRKEYFRITRDGWFRYFAPFVFNENPSLPVPLLLFVYLKERKSVWFSRKKIVILSLSLSIILCSREAHVYYLSYVGFPFYFPRLSQETDDQRRLDTIPSKEHGRIARPWRR